MEASILVLDIIEAYRIPLPNGVIDQIEFARIQFLPIIDHFVTKNETIPLILPAFPFKSPNTIAKTLGVLPDKAEEVSLAHLNGICENIRQVYSPGARLYIVSDGLVYNDLLGVSDGTVYDYGEGVRRLAHEKEFTNIRFARLKDLLGMQELPSQMSKELYEENAPTFRDQLVQRNVPDSFDPHKEIMSNEDAMATFRGYNKFLVKDLLLKPCFKGLSKTATKKRIEMIALQMITRGKAFASAIDKAFPNHIRLSIHPSSGRKKFSISLVNGEQKSSVTPWHACLRTSLNGAHSFAYREVLQSDENLELIHDKTGRPLYFREKSDLYNLGLDDRVEFNNLYPTGLIIESADPSLSLKDIDMKKVRSIAELNSPIIIRGFADTTDRESFLAAARRLGEIQPWLFGDLLEVKDRGRDERGMNSTLSAEPLPFHFDGIFKTKTVIDEDGLEKFESQVPRFQMFSSIVPAPKGTGLTLFASSRLLFENLPSLTINDLSKFKWTCSTTSFKGVKLEHIPLVIAHPVLGTPCLRYHENWPQSKTAFRPAESYIENDEQGLTALLDRLLYDRRVSHYYAWEKGDVILSDNISMMHTRTAFKPGSDREFWRVHID
ncbi:putative pyoverdine/dityrosine biosynthesis protein [Patellaria atrata CBS 101060]|uniref:Pyoverdine/dityrosine biosynthesis protein n=1 Tax=Patellaria atrata CBS 101060 TaxID=1346257 RepID=A0A9P4SGS9_9PEZI|nr:putative pyoverdine/dityrosine biosynthesis protein [Patellaria atrata CBS 101060]